MKHQIKDHIGQVIHEGDVLAFRNRGYMSVGVVIKTHIKTVSVIVLPTNEGIKLGDDRSYEVLEKKLNNIKKYKRIVNDVKTGVVLRRGDFINSPTYGSAGLEDILCRHLTTWK